MVKPLDIRSQTAMVFHLDKCIGCHTCSVACKNIWTDRPGAEYMWWNNVETKPGTGYPTRWEDQLNYKGGWKLNRWGKLVLRSQNRWSAFLRLFYNPHQPGMDDYYEPWTYRYDELFNAPAGDDQPTAIPVSQITGRPMKIEAGPNWDDDLSGSPIYARNDPNFEHLTPAEREMLASIESISMMYLPRICNHCANPSCVASCPSGALYKRGEDGVVLINQDKCRGWRACIAACPYKKIYFNWKTGKSEKCILCYPRLETGQPPACFHSCVGRIRYMGVLLYDASRVEEAMRAPEASLVEAQRGALLDPYDPAVIRAAERAGISSALIESAQKSPVWKYVVKWRLALPLHPEFRTMPMLFYVPPLLPVMGRVGEGLYDNDEPGVTPSLERARLPMKYLASLFSAGQVEVIETVMKKLLAIRAFKRSELPGQSKPDSLKRLLQEAQITPQDAEEIYQLTACADPSDRFVLPPLQREEHIEGAGSPESCKGSCGLPETWEV